MPSSFTQAAAVPAALPAATTDGSSAEMQLRYAAASRGANDTQLLVLCAGVRARYAAQLDIDAGKRQALEASFIFVAEPPLPHGLDLHPKTGAISGVPAEAQAQRSLHKITISVPATGPCGISLGDLPLTSCVVGIRVIDLQRYHVTAAHRTANGAESFEHTIELTAF